MITDKITKYLEAESITVDHYLKKNVEKLAGFAFKRQFMGEKGESKGKLRLSYAGKCARQIAYKYHGYEVAGKEIDGRAKIIFFQGDLVELMLMNLAKLAGCNVMATGLEQVTLSIPIDVGGCTHVEGHPDGYIIHGGCKLVECKSMSSFAYSRFDKGEIDDAYRAQINMYLEASGLTECVLVAMNKDNGVIGELMVEKDAKIVEGSKEKLASVISSTKDDLPEGMYECNEKNIYPWQCLYCGYHCLCHVNAEKVLIGRSYKLKEKEEEVKEEA